MTAKKSAKKATPKKPVNVTDAGIVPPKTGNYTICGVTSESIKNQVIDALKVHLPELKIIVQARELATLDRDASCVVDLSTVHPNDQFHLLRRWRALDGYNIALLDGTLGEFLSPKTEDVGFNRVSSKIAIREDLYLRMLLQTTDAATVLSKSANP